jgi:aerobic-type carbon monoxide dehydrogenase small subunit (CoxS/CutS family)
MSSEARLIEGPRLVQLVVNGEEHTGVAEPRTLLSDFLRQTLGLTGTHVGCEHGVCGACTVRLEDDIVRSCLLFAIQVDGARVATVEGLASGTQLHPIQVAFREQHGLQCGYCTPGLLVTALKLLELNPSPSEGEIREYLAGNVCRCTGYVGVIAAVQAAAHEARARVEREP